MTEQTLVVVYGRVGPMVVDVPCALLGSPNKRFLWCKQSHQTGPLRAKHAREVEGTRIFKYACESLFYPSYLLSTIGSVMASKVCCGVPNIVADTSVRSNSSSGFEYICRASYVSPSCHKHVCGTVRRCGISCLVCLLCRGDTEHAQGRDMTREVCMRMSIVAILHVVNNWFR